MIKTELARIKELFVAVLRGGGLSSAGLHLERKCTA